MLLPIDIPPTTPTCDLPTAPAPGSNIIPVSYFIISCA